MQNPIKEAAGRKGGFIRWSKVDKKKRSAMMRKIAKARWAKMLVEAKLK